MDIVHYQRVRKELIADYKRLKTRGYRMQVPFQIFLSVEEIEDIETFHKEGIITVGNSLRDHRPQTVTPIMLVNLIKRLNSETNIGFDDPEDAVEIYETIQRYLNNWMDIAEYAPQFFIPEIQELYDLEDLAVWLFGIYKTILLRKRFIQQRDAKRESKKITDPFMALLNLSVMTDETQGAPVFNSVLDARLPQRLKDHYKATKANDVDKWLFDSDVFK